MLRKAWFGLLMIAIASVIGLASHVGSASAYSFCPPSGYSPPQPTTVQCEEIYSPSASYLHQGNASYFLSYQYNFPYTQNDARWRLIPAGQFINMFTSPTSYTYRVSSTEIVALIYWFRPDNRTYCWYQGDIHGSDQAPWISTGLGVGCGGY